jgi:hypothetical protein
MNNKRILVILSLIVATMFVTFLFDHRKVNLEYIGSLSISPPITDDVFKGCAWNACSGRTMQYCLHSTEERLFDISNKRFTIMPENIQFQDNAIYYYGIGCSIDTINYFYHSRYFNAMNDAKGFEANTFTGTVLPIRNLIIIYKGDVFVSGI